MPTWGGVLKELQASQPNPTVAPKFDEVRRKYLLELHRYTNRAVILYSTKFASAGGQIPPETLSITEEDIQGLMEAVHGLSGDELDLIIHSPGGSIDAAEALVTYLRSKFTDIRAIVPNVAMSAAAMICCAADQIVMGKHSFLGPIDPQFVIPTSTGPRSVSAEAILEQFERAKQECTDPANLGAWIPMLSQYGPDLLVKCTHACDRSKNLAQGWLEKYMFRGRADGAKQAKKIAAWLSLHRNFQSHGKHIPRDELRKKGLKIFSLEKDQRLQDLVLSIFHATNHTFNGTGVLKIIENHQGQAFLKQIQPVPQVQLPLQFLQPAPPKVGGAGDKAPLI